MSRYTVSLDSKLSLQKDRAGGKGASLAWLRRNGFNVPPGFVVTPAAFQDFLTSLGIERLAKRADGTHGSSLPAGCLPSASDLERIRELLMACRIPDPVARSIGRAYRKLVGRREPGGPVAVRSSMIGEDTTVTSFAGQLDTTLNVQGEQDLLTAVKRCWASMFNWRLIRYLVEHETLRATDGPAPADNKHPGTVLEHFSIAVVVQRMVQGKAAGVAFSADPVTGAPCVVIEAVSGLGDSLVRGLAHPDRYVVDARGVLAEAVPAHADNKHPEDELVLGENDVLRLAAVVRDIASRTDTPQDIEWAWDGTRFHILQSRPITSLIGQRTYSTSMVSEMLPGLIKPLVWSVSTTSKLRNVLGRIFTELIAPTEAVGETNIDFALLAKRIHSRVYANNTMLGELLERMGLPANLFEVMSRDEQVERRPRPPLTSKSLRTMIRLLRFVWRYSRVTDEISAFIERHNHELEPYRQADWSSQEPHHLLAQVDQLIHIYSETMWVNFIGPLNMMARNRLLCQMVQRWAPDVVPSDLVRGLMGLKSLESNRELHNLAAQARSLGLEIQHLLTMENDETIRAALSASEEGRAMADKMDAFLDRYGFLSASGTDPSRTPWVENPTVIWHAIGRGATDWREAVQEDVEAVRERARRHVQANLNWIQRIIFDRLLASTIAYIRLRERSSFLISEDSFEMRRLFLALGDHLVQHGAMNQRDDIFYLTHDEIKDWVEGKLEAASVRELVTTRSAEMEADVLIDPPSTICGDYVPTQPITRTEGQEHLTGIIGSSGLARGHARVLLDPAEAPPTLTRDDILVVPFTDVSWTPLFAGVGGVVAETGGQLSHSAIVAREYGLPAVVNVKHATRLIEDGQTIIVDGNHGRVVLK